VADANATLQETVEYGAYGQTVYKDAVSGSTATVSYTGNPYGYTGREPDAETGLYYYRARYYDVEAGRFIQSAPIGFGGGDTNLYAYVVNNPINLYDPSGWKPKKGNPPSRAPHRLTCVQRFRVQSAVNAASARRNDSLLSRMVWFKSVVGTEKIYDFKNKVNPRIGKKYDRTDPRYTELEALGNYNYGAMFAALFPDRPWELSGLGFGQWSAGVYSWVTNGSKNKDWGNPLSNYPWGDDPRYENTIANGYFGVDDLAVPDH